MVEEPPPKKRKSVQHSIDSFFQKAGSDEAPSKRVAVRYVGTTSQHQLKVCSNCKGEFSPQGFPNHIRSWKKIVKNAMTMIAIRAHKKVVAMAAAQAQKKLMKKTVMMIAA